MIRRLRGDIPSIDKNTYPSIKEFERYQKIVNPLSHKERGLDKV